MEKKLISQELQKDEVLGFPVDYNGFIRYVAWTYFDKDVKFAKKFFNALRNINPGHCYMVAAMILAKLLDKNYDTHIGEEDVEKIYSVLPPRTRYYKITPVVRNRHELSLIKEALMPLKEKAYEYFKNISYEQKDKERQGERI